ncbi:Peroxiredoxin-like 2A [Labeo rohita]|uniref:Peroxiredoxin-like 2A n=1 Tax=Labeo rohita TaxID=84645 RepID=A0ABQ8M5N1_LABRO|nr:Peroxiredoxin-like 2A [Labeo rohita]
MEPVTRTVSSLGLTVIEALRSFTELFLTQPLCATLSHLGETDLRTLDGDDRVFKARELWESSGAVIMAEASDLSSLKSQLDERGVALVAVVKENIGSEIHDFRPYFNGEIFLDQQRGFYGPQERWMGVSGILRAGVWMNGWRAYQSGYGGNVRGEGFVLGAVYVIGPGQQFQCEIQDKPLESSTADMFLQDLEGVCVGLWSAGVCVVVVYILLANTDLFLTKPDHTSLDTLASAELTSTSGEDEVNFKAVSLWERTGAVIMAEASDLSSLKPQLDERGVALVAVVKENIGSEIHDFRAYFDGQIFLDQQMCFYGVKRRTMRSSGFARFGVWRNLLQVWRRGYHGNREGEGYVLGGLYVIGPENQGILLEHHEKEFGDKADLTAVRMAVSWIQKTEETQDN